MKLKNIRNWHYNTHSFQYLDDGYQGKLANEKRSSLVLGSLCYNHLPHADIELFLEF